jgi:hypothetical protein
VKSVPSVLVLADGTTFEGYAAGYLSDEGCHQRRVRLQHRPQRVPGGHHRPQLRRSDHQLHLPAHWQLRCHAPRRRVTSSLVRGHRRARALRPPSNWRSVGPLEGFLRQHVPAIVGVDTRRLTKHLRATAPCPAPSVTPTRSGAAAAARGRRYRQRRPGLARDDARPLYARRRCAARGRLRLRHQDHDGPPPRPTIPRHGRALVDQRRRRAGPRTRRRLPLEWSGRPRRVGRAGRP